MHPPRPRDLSRVSLQPTRGTVKGVGLFTRFTRYAAYIVMAWLLAISLNLIPQGPFLDVAVRDIIMAIAAFSLAKLTEVRETSAVTETTHVTEWFGEPASRAA